MLYEYETEVQIPPKNLSLSYSWHIQRIWASENSESILEALFIIIDNNRMFVVPDLSCCLLIMRNVNLSKFLLAGTMALSRCMFFILFL